IPPIPDQPTDTNAVDTASDPPEQPPARQNPDTAGTSSNEMTIDTPVDSTPGTDAPQSTTVDGNGRTDPDDSASGGDTSSDDSTRPTSEGSTESSDSTSEEENQEDKPEEEPADWADIVEDTSMPDENELKEIENADADYSAYEYDYWESTFYRDPDDPEYRASEKARLTWKIKGVRGTKEKPNRATIMRSPAAYVGGHYWTIKFFPRGNSVSSLSIYVECSAIPPEPDKDTCETEFKVLRGPPDADLSKLTPVQELSLPAGPRAKETKSTPPPDEGEKGRGQCRGS
ncbi:predicted protein, partial [Uncinocarpus reesii 1704]